MVTERILMHRPVLRDPLYENGAVGRHVHSVYQVSATSSPAYSVERVDVESRFH